MGLFDAIAEARIQEGIARGDFDGLPGEGRPLELEDLSRVPADLRAAVVLLDGAGYLPEEMRLRKEVLRLGQLIAACEDAGERERLAGERSAAALSFELLMERRRTRLDARYRSAIRRRLGRR